MNAVGGGELGVDLDLVSIAKREDIVDIQYEPETSPSLCFRFQTRKKSPTIILYRTGSFSIAGAMNITDLKNAHQKLINYVERLGLEPNQDDFEIRYLVFKFDIGREIDLNELCNELDSDLVEYEPEQFPQLKYDPEQYDGVFMISRTGSMIYTGDSSPKNAKSAIDNVSEQILELFNTK